MRKSVVHYVYNHPRILGEHLIACGLPLWLPLWLNQGFDLEQLINANFRKRKVTCNNCRKTKIFRGVK